METLVDTATMATMLKVKPSTLDLLRRRGDIPSLRVGKHARFDPNEVIKKLREGN